MKLKLLFIGAILCLSLSSCQNEQIYSCDPVIDRMVKENLAEIKLMTRTDFLKFSLNEERAIFKAMSPEQRYGIWEGKLKELLSDTWKPKERKHLETLLFYLQQNKTLFNGEQKLDNDDFILFMYKWAEYAQDTLSWDKETLYSIAANPKTAIKTTVKGEVSRLSIFNEISITNKLIKTRGESSDPSCDCRADDYMNWCSNRQIGLDCTGSCIEDDSNLGCGWIFLQKCTGICE